MHGRSKRADKKGKNTLFCLCTDEGMYILIGLLRTEYQEGQAYSYCKSVPLS